MLESAFALLALAACSFAAPIYENEPEHVLKARALLGTSFGVPNLNRTFDYIVVGGGNAGLTIASRLSEDPSKLVAVVEAGSFYELTNGNLSQIPSDDIWWDGKSPLDVNPGVDWGFVTTPQVGENGNSSHYARGKTLGGCSARNYMAYQRPTKDSLKRWATEVGDDSYTFEKFLPYYQKSLNFTPPDNSKRGQNATPAYDEASLGTGGPLDITFSNYAQAFSTWAIEGLKTLGVVPIDGFTSGKLIGQSWVIATINHTIGSRESSETAFLDPALSRGNLVTYVNTMGKKVTFTGKKATGVVVETMGYTYNLAATSEVIISAGTFQSPQMLMVSGIGPAATLQQNGIEVLADRPGVGQNMWDHILFGPSWKVNVITGSALGDPTFAAQAVEEFNNEAGGILSSSGGDFLAWEKVPQPYRSNLTNSSISDLATFPADWPEIEWLSVGGYFGFQNNYIRDGPTDGAQYATMSMALVAPLSRGNITINSSDTNVLPLVNPNWLSSLTDQQVAVAAFKRAREFAATPAMQKIIIGEEAFPGPNVQSDADLLELIKESFNTVYHASATCKMGKLEDKMAVVDSQAKVIGVEGLRVVDASAFPFLPPGHPMATVYALAEKIAADIMGKY